MKITSVETVGVEVNHRGNWLFVRVHTDEGLVGLGEASHSGDDGLLAAAIRHRLGPQLAGQDASRVAALSQRLPPGSAGPLLRTAASALEQALWDLNGQALGVPIHRFWGGPVRQRIRLYANINRATNNRRPEGFAANARAAAAEGFHGVKLAPFDDVQLRELDQPETWRTIELGLERVRAVRETVGPDVLVLVDCHSRLTPALAARVVRELESVGLFWLEDPVPHDELDGLAEVRAGAETMIASGERYQSSAEFREMIVQRAADVLMPDIKHVGGYAELHRVSALAEPWHVLIAPHNPSGPVAAAASVQACASLANFLILEYAWGEVPYRASLVDPPERIEDGFLTVPDRPGLGLSLNDEAIAEHAFDPLAD
ncbi:MAG: hypothetical protein CL878_07505 [Dehalococcoidia bacterium]|nr:hypothetical protein [Dehalococcoidia bacterium]